MILDVSNGGYTKQKQRTALSYGHLKEYLFILIENNLIEYLDGKNRFKTTEKELNFLTMHNQIEELLQTNQNN